MVKKKPVKKKSTTKSTTKKMKYVGKVSAEKVKKILPRDIPLSMDGEDDLLFRIAECQAVIDELERSNLWKIVVRDKEALRQTIDENWQTMNDEQLNKARVVKMALVEILNLRGAYEEEIKARRAELNQLNNIENEVIRDYDQETNMEE